MSTTGPRLRQKLLILLIVIGGFGIAAFGGVLLLANQQIFDSLLPQSRALQDLESRVSQLLQDYYRFMLTPELVAEENFVDSLKLIRDRLAGYERLIEGQVRLEVLAGRIAGSIDMLELAGDTMIGAHHQNLRILARAQQLENEVDSIFRQYLGEVSRDIAIAIESRDWTLLTRRLLPELRMAKSINQQFLELQLEIREYQIEPDETTLLEIENLQQRIAFSNTMFQLWVENSVSRAAISAEILQIFDQLNEVVGRFTAARGEAEFALSRAEQAGIDLNQAIDSATAYTETLGWVGLQRALFILGWVLLATLAASYLFIYVGLDRALRPLERLRDSIGLFGQGNLRQRSDIRRGDEIGQLAQAFNGMAEQVETKTLQEQQLIKQLESKNAELERFTYTVSHELKSPLVTMSGFLGHLQKDLADGSAERVQFDMERITEAIATMGIQLDDLLELSRVGHASNPPTRFSIHDLCRKQMTVMEGLIRARAAEIEIDAGMPNAIADEARIGEVLRNLIENGIKFTPEGRRPCISISAEASDGRVTCRVRDNGIGIEPRFHDKVFGLFDRLDNSVPGTGVGLAIVRRIVEIHGGVVWIDSQGNGQGSCFCFTLPHAQGA